LTGTLECVIRGRKEAETFYEVKAGGFYEVKAGGFYEVKAKMVLKKHRTRPISESDTSNPQIGHVRTENDS
jgi:hypothetical protein